MPDVQTSSPVVPSPGSRLWTAGASGGLAVLILLALAVYDPAHAAPLIGGALLVAVTTWLVANQRPVMPEGNEDSDGGTRDETRPAGQIALLEEVFETVSDPLLVVRGGEPDDMAGRRVVLANRAARDLLRIPREGAILVSVLRDPTLLEAVDEALFGGVSRETNFDSGGVQARHWRAMTRPLPASATETLALVRLRDETDVRRMELRRVDFLANASHELRTPLASLSGFIETLRGPAKDDPAAREKFLGIMREQATRMSRLIDDLLSLSRIEMKRHVPISTRVDLGAILRKVESQLAPLAEQLDVELALDLPEEPVAIPGDEDELMQVFSNLVENACKYGETGKRVEISLTRTVDAGGSFVDAAVRDFGPGIPAEHVPRLTERFYRVDPGRSRAKRGTGLGLSITRNILLRHRGRLLVESTIGKGSVFTARLPLARLESGDSENHHASQ